MLARDWPKRLTWPNTGEYPRIIPNFQICARCEKDLKDNKDNSRHLGRNMLRYLPADISVPRSEQVMSADKFSRQMRLLFRYILSKLYR